MAMVKRFEVYLVNIDDRPSDDAKNTRPAVVVSPDEMNKHSSYAIVAPVSAGIGGKYPTRIPIELLNSERVIVLDQIRTVDKIRLVKKIGEIGKTARRQTLERLQEMFAE
jgi:mRNA interferase MazF